MLRSPGSAQSPPSLSLRTPRRSNVRGGADSRDPAKGRQIEGSSAKSCNNCRARKVKCNSVHPKCGACVRRKQECIYGRDARFSRSGLSTPRRRQGNNSNLPANTESPRLHSAEINYRVNDGPLLLFSPNSHNDQHFAQATHSDDGSLMEYDGINVPRYLGNSDTTPSERGTLDHALDDERLEDNSSAINPEKDSREDTDCRDSQIQILSFFHDAYGLQPATGSFRNGRMNQAADEVRQARLIANAAVRRQQEKSILQSRRWDANVDFDGVDPDLALHLLDLHWNTCHLIWLVSYRPAIVDSLFHGGPYVNKLLLNAIYYSSSLYSDRAVIRSALGQSSAGDMFYSRFCELIRTEPYQPCLPTAIALILCTASLLSRGLTRDCVELRDKAWQMVAKLECPWRSTTDKLPPGDTPLVVEIEREMRNRLYLGMVGLDTLIGLYLGQPATGLGSCHPMIKILDTFEELEDWAYYIDPTQTLDHCLQVQNPAPSRTISTFMAQMSLYGILSDVLRFFHSHTSASATFEFSWTVKSFIEQQLAIWRHNLPSHLQFDLDPKPNLLPHHVALLVTFYAIRILIQRPFLEGKHLGRHHNRHRRAASEKQSADDIKIIWQLLIEYQQTYTLRRAPMLISFSAYTALMAVVDKRLTDASHNVCIESLWSMLLELRDKSSPGLQNVLDGIRKEFFNIETNLVNVSQRSEGGSLPNQNPDNMGIATPDRSPPENSLGPERMNASLFKSPMNGDELQVSSDENDEYEVARFVNLWCPKNSDEFLTWLRSSVEMMETKTLLRDTLRAISKLYFGKESKNAETIMRGQQLYISVLGSVNHQLSSPTCNTSIDLLIAVVLLAMIELYRPHEESSMDQHWMASFAILESRGPLRHITGVEHQVFTDLRYHWVIRSLIRRETTFLSRDEWKLLPWQGSNSKSALQHVLDYVLEIPTLLERFDQHSSLAAAGALSPSEDRSMKASLFTWVDDIRSHLEGWKRTYAATYPHGSQFEPPVTVSSNNNQTPVFQYLSPDTNELVTPKPLFYPNITLAVSLGTYSMAHLKLFTIQPPANHFEQEEQYLHACNISRSISYFFEYRSSPLVLRVIHSLRTAYEVFKEGSLEKKCVRNMFLLIGDRYHFDFFSSQVPE